ncbi:MAG: hypothetical protein PSV16_04930 [Flavobacterium sp.]|nr:hypothetical protein [Flavobacterium sp.]
MKKSLSLFILALALCCVSISSSSQPFSSKNDQFIEVSVQQVILKPGDSISRYFGDLTINLKLSNTGRSVECNMYLSTQLIGVQTLTAEQSQYPFDLQLADYKANGTLTLQINETPDAFSKVSGIFTYTVVANHQSFICKGDLIAWHLN